MADFHEREKGGEALNIEHLRLKKELCFAILLTIYWVHLLTTQDLRQCVLETVFQYTLLIKYRAR